MRRLKEPEKLAAPLIVFAGGISERKLMVYAASGCYYLFMSLVPLSMVLCCLLPYTPFSQEMILGYVDQYFAESLANVVRRIVSAIYASSAATLTVSAFLSMYSASAGMKALMNGMDAAYGLKRKEGFLRFTLRALVYMFALIAALLASLGILVYGGKLIELAARWIPYVSQISQTLAVLRFPVVMLLLAVVFSAFYTIMPAEKMRFRRQIPGGIFSAVVWVLFSLVFSWYVDFSDKYGAYGFMGTIMVAMLWIYYCLLFLLIGGYLNSWLIVRKISNSGIEMTPDGPECY